MDDIEDLVLSEDYWEYNRRLERSTVTARVRRRNKTSNVQLARQVGYMSLGLTAKSRLKIVLLLLLYSVVLYCYIDCLIVI